MHTPLLRVSMLERRDECASVLHWKAARCVSRDLLIGLVEQHVCCCCCESSLRFSHDHPANWTNFKMKKKVGPDIMYVARGSIAIGAPHGSVGQWEDVNAFCNLVSTNYGRSLSAFELMLYVKCQQSRLAHLPAGSDD